MNQIEKQSGRGTAEAVPLPSFSVSFFFRSAGPWIIAAAEIRVDLVGQKPDPEPAGSAEGAAGQTQVLGHHKPDAPDLHVPALREVVGRDRCV